MTLRQRWKQTSLPNKLLVIIGGFAAFATFLSVGLAYFQYRLAVQSSEEMDRQIEKFIVTTQQMVGEIQTANANQVTAMTDSTAQSKAAIESAYDIGAMQLEQQREAMRIERRAWIGVTEMQDLTISAGVPVGFRVIITNSGQTPGFITQSTVRARYQPIEETFSAVYTGVNFSSRSVVHPGMRISTGAGEGRPVTETDVAAIRSEGGRFYIFGEIRYQDVFGVEHMTRYCQYVQPDLRTLSWCDSYNEAD